MSGSTKPMAWQVLCAGPILGLWGDLLFRAGDPPGIDVLLWIGAIAAAAWTFRLGHWRTHRWLLPTVFAIAAAFAWRDSGWLGTIDFWVLALLLAVPTLQTETGSLVSMGLARIARGICQCWGRTAVGCGQFLARDLSWRDLRGSGAGKRFLRLGIGVAIALPFLFLFGELLTAADAGFEAFLHLVVALDLRRWIGDALLIVTLTWLVIGHLRALGSPATPVVAQAEARPLGIIEAGTVLFLLDLLFALFVAFQLPYLFGGAIAARSHSYADYARRGFFELVWVMALVLPLLLVLEATTERQDAQQERIFRWLAAAQILLLMVMGASAVQRMGLYADQFGLTTLRIHVLIAEGWLVGLLLWFACTALRGKRERFAWGAIAWALIVASASHLPNWEELIVRANTGFASSGKAVDVDYLVRLGADAVPALLVTRARLTAKQRGTIARDLLTRSYGGPWPSWNWARERAAKAIERNRVELNREAAVH